jgi:hypothetical protein
MKTRPVYLQDWQALQKLHLREAQMQKPLNSERKCRII